MGSSRPCPIKMIIFIAGIDFHPLIHGTSLITLPHPAENRLHDGIDFLQGIESVESMLWSLKVSKFGLIIQLGMVMIRIRARICKRLWSPGIDSEESVPPSYVA
jgi:hypothetical protein